VAHQHKFEAIAALLEAQIDAGKFRAGDKLPSIRALQAQFNASVTTLQNAYERLAIRGYVESVPKSGYYVKARAAAPQPGVVVHDPVFINKLSATLGGYEQRHLNPEFNIAAPGDLFIPQKLLLRTFQEVIREKGMELLRYYPPNGSATLRNLISQRAAFYNASLHPDHIIITDGVLQALYIGLAAITRPGDIIAIESPCVFSVLEVIRVLGLKTISVPIHPQKGFDMDLFRKICRSKKIKALVVTPNFHNPTGALMTDGQKQALLEVAVQAQVPVIENDIYGDLYFSGSRPANIQSWDSSGLVLTISSYSKTLASGIRLGWLSPGKYFAQAEALKFAFGRTVSPIYQEVLIKLLSTGSYDRHLKKFRQQLARQAQVTEQLLKQHFPKGTRFSKPAGGFSMWVQMPGEVNMEQFYSFCEQYRIRFTPGYCFSFVQDFERHFRVVFTEKYTSKHMAALQRAGQKAGRLSRGA
jgi:DNA-binding transcriptional MocR family regulator